MAKTATVTTSWLPGFEPTAPVEMPSTWTALFEQSATTTQTRAGRVEISKIGVEQVASSRLGTSSFADDESADSASQSDAKADAFEDGTEPVSKQVASAWRVHLTPHQDGEKWLGKFGQSG